MGYKPTSTGYLTPFLEANQLSKWNHSLIHLESEVSLVANQRSPYASTTGNGIFHIGGKLEVTGTPAANMLLGTIPDDAAVDMQAPVVVQSSGGAYTVGVVHINGTEILFQGTPNANDIIHLEGVTYLSNLLIA